MNKRWTIKSSSEKQKIQPLAAALNVDEIIAEMLVQRGISTFEEAKNFFRPELSQLHNPFLMKDMDAAVSRIEKAISSNEKILIYGDYDVDGTSAVALVYSFFNSHITQIAKKDLTDSDCRLHFYIPDRYTEGYGISYAGIDFAKQNEFSLIIALDCGIKANEKIDYANKSGIDFIICDHHTPGDKIPNAVAVLDPKRSDCFYPYKELSGCGIGFKLVQAFAQKNKIQFENLFPLLDLVAISIASDIVPITGENRILAYYGLKRIQEFPRKGIKALLSVAQFKKTELTISDLVFIIGPRINAAGRIEHGKKAVELLISDDDSVAQIVGKSIDETNESRKELDREITQHALQLIEEKNLLQRKTTVLFHEEWHKGVIGIVASRLIEKHYRPTILLTKSNGFAVGSARSVRGFDIYDAIDKCSDLLEQFGGHKYAAGLTLKIENIDKFSEKFEQIVSENIEEHLLIPEIQIDAEINFSDITPKFFRILKQFAPFGPENMTPIFVTHNVIDTGFSRIVGENHLKLYLFQKENPQIKFSAIAFQMGEFYTQISSKKPFSICYTIEENVWNGNVSLELNVRDVKMS